MRFYISMLLASATVDSLILNAPRWVFAVLGGKTAAVVVFAYRAGLSSRGNKTIDD